MVEGLIRNAKILLVDDQESNVRYLERILHQEGAVGVTSTMDPRQAVALCAAVLPDLLVLDLMMPYLDGYEVMRQIQARVPQDYYLPILILTADVSAATRRRALSAGAHDFLAKPFDPVEAVLRIANLLAIRFLHRELQNRIARDIHDGPLQDLGVLLLRIEQCKRQIEDGAPAAALASLQRLRADVRETVEGMRTLVHNLRPPVLDSYGLLGAIDFLIDRVRQDCTIMIAFESHIGVRLHPTLESVVFHLVQEALSNIRQHAGAAHAWVTLSRVEDRLQVLVRDDGQGFPVADRRQEALLTGHVGLAGMYERAKVAGGQLTIDSSPGTGTTLRITLPFQAHTGPSGVADAG